MANAMKYLGTQMVKAVHLITQQPRGARFWAMEGPKVMDGEKTISVPEAGRRYFGLSRGGSYEAAARGDLPTIRIGRLLRVPVKAMELLLDGVTRSGSGQTTGSRQLEA
jgi:hypothetical protein